MGYIYVTVFERLKSGQFHFILCISRNSTNIISYTDLSVLYTWKIIFHVFDLLSFVRYGRSVVCVFFLKKYFFIKKKNNVFPLHLVFHLVFFLPAYSFCVWFQCVSGLLNFNYFIIIFLFKWKLKNARF